MTMSIKTFSCMIYANLLNDLTEVRVKLKISFDGNKQYTIALLKSVILTLRKNYNYNCCKL